MPKGPQGQKRPADVIGSTIMVARLATGEIQRKSKEPSGRVRSGIAGAKARAESMMKEERSAAASLTAHLRWSE